MNFDADVMDRLREQNRESTAYWKGYHQNERDNYIEPLLTPKQIIYVLFTIRVLLLGLMFWLLGTIIIRSIT